MKKLLLLNVVFTLSSAAMSPKLLEGAERSHAIESTGKRQLLLTDSKPVTNTRISKRALLGHEDENLTVSNERFIVNVGGEYKEVPKYMVDPILLKLSPEQMVQFQKVAKIVVIHYSDGTIGLKAYIPGVGGGWLGAQIGFWGAKTAVYVVGHGSIIGISTVVGSVNAYAGAFVWEKLTLYGAPMIEQASNTAGLAGAIVLGSTTPA